MKIKDFLKDYLSTILFYSILILLVSSVSFLDGNESLSVDNIIYINIIGAFLLAVFLIHEYFKKKKNFDILEGLINRHQEDFVGSLPEPVNNEQKLYFRLVEALNEEHYLKFSKLSNDKKEFVNFIDYWVHEIKTPITGSRLLLEDQLNKSKEELVSIMEDKLDSIESHVEQALYYSRLDSFVSDYIIGDVDMNDLIKSLIKKHARMFIAKKIKIELSGTEIVINSDKKWLSFIIEQILMNALKYTGRNGIIKISCKEEYKEKCIVIEDNGVGIKLEDVERVFDKGFTGYNGRENLKATGLGLYLSKKLANKLGHEITIESQFSKFTRVIVHFPKLSDYYKVAK